MKLNEIGHDIESAGETCCKTLAQEVASRRFLEVGLLFLVALETELAALVLVVAEVVGLELPVHCRVKVAGLGARRGQGLEIIWVFPIR
jgi:hypothetical protein